MYLRRNVFQWKCALISKFHSSASQKTSESIQSKLFYKEDHIQLQQALCKLIESEVNPYVDQWEQEGQFPGREIFKKLGSAGFLGIHRPKEYGGLGLDYTYNLAMLEALGTINCGGIPMAVSVQTDMATPAITRYGSEKMKKEFLVPTISGDYISCIGVSEVGCGSDVASITTRASRKGDDLIINGGKMWITNGFQADWMCLLANTSDDHFHTNKSLICLPMKLPGITLAKKIDKLGQRSSDTAQIFFEDVRISKDHVIGKEGMGFVYQMKQFQEERMAASTILLAAFEKVIKQTIEYCKERKSFGKPLINNQVIHFRLAELETEVELLRSLIYNTAGAFVQGQNVTKLASMCKLKAGRLARELADSCLQLWGGMGYTNEVFVSRAYRDFRLVSIGGGSDEIMLRIICKLMDILPENS